MELMLQYEGGVGAFITGAITYDIDLDAMAEAAWSNIPAHILKEARGAWIWAQQKKTTYGLEEKTYIVCDSLKRMWREAHPAISSYWPELKNCFIRATENPGSEIICRKTVMRKVDSWLRITMPSGRSLCYASPRNEEGKISYMGIHHKSRKWTRIPTYGGKVFENYCQFVACDVMAENMPEIENAGYDILFTVHDEDVTEAPANDNYTADKLSRLLAAQPSWATELPLAANGYESQRYRKD